MDTEDRIRDLEERLARAEARIAELEARPLPLTQPVTIPFTDPNGTSSPPWRYPNHMPYVSGTTC